MATEKILNTRLQLKYDTLANWTSSTFIPKKGEACIVEVPTGTSVTGVVNPPAIMIKVGNGTDKFSALPWTAATAADVYTWAKKSGIEIEERAGTNDGSYVNELVWDSTTNKLVPKVVAFDTAMSATSTNAVQNKVVKAAIDAAEKAAKDYSDSNEKTSSVSNTADKVIKVTPKTTGNNTDYALDFQYDNSGNVKFEETANGLKATVSITDVKVDNAVSAEKDGAGNNIVSTYATKAEITAKEALWSKDTVTSVHGVNAIEVTNTTAGDPNYEVALKINNGTPGNVTLTQDTNGLKANIDLSGYKTKQTAVADKITDDAHVLTSLTQNANGVISYEVKKLTPANIGAQPAGSYKTTQDVVNTPAASGNATAFIDTISQDTNGVITVTKKNITAADLGLSNAMHFLGTTTTAVTDGGSEKPTIDGAQKTPVAGDIVLYGNQEFIYNSSNKWELLGDEGSHALKATAIPGGELINSTAKLDGTGAISHAVPTGASAKTSTAGNSTLSHGGKLKLPTITTDKFGHVTGTGTEEVTLPSVPNIGFGTDTQYAVSTESKIELPVISGLTANGHTLTRNISKITSNGDITIDGYVAASGDVQGDVELNIANGAVITEKLADSAVSTAKINSEAVTAAKLASNAVTTAKIADSNVTTAKIANTAVTADKLATDSVITAKIKDGNVTKAKLESTVQTSLGKADSALQASDVVLTADTASFPDFGGTMGYYLYVDGKCLNENNPFATSGDVRGAALASEISVNIGTGEQHNTIDLLQGGELIENATNIATAAYVNAAIDDLTDYVDTRKISAEQTKAYVTAEKQTSDEVWVFYCGDASHNI